jgi:hypothetical protein
MTTGAQVVTGIVSGGVTVSYNGGAAAANNVQALEVSGKVASESNGILVV